MVLRVDVMDAALRGFYGIDPLELHRTRRVIALTPSGRLLDDRLVDELAAEPDVTLLCGRYEGFDERVVERYATDAVSIGRYVLAGGELAAMVVCDAVLRKLPGALGASASAREESYSVALDGRPEYPHYTRPAEFRGWKVPDVLLSGHHEEIRRWREQRSLERAAQADAHASQAAARQADARASDGPAEQADARASDGPAEQGDARASDEPAEQADARASDEPAEQADARASDAPTRQAAGAPSDGPAKGPSGAATEVTGASE
jgi:tRNA (guanine37-N1)-methyltransferase